MKTLVEDEKSNLRHWLLGQNLSSASIFKRGAVEGEVHEVVGRAVGLIPIPVPDPPALERRAEEGGRHHPARQVGAQPPATTQGDRGAAREIEAEFQYLAGERVPLPPRSRRTRPSEEAL